MPHRDFFSCLRESDQDFYDRSGWVHQRGAAIYLPDDDIIVLPPPKSLLQRCVPSITTETLFYQYQCYKFMKSLSTKNIFKIINFYLLRFTIFIHSACSTYLRLYQIFLDVLALTAIVCNTFYLNACDLQLLIFYVDLSTFIND